jgi:hypothetical protein
MSSIDTRLTTIRTNVDRLAANGTITRDEQDTIELALTFVAETQERTDTALQRTATSAQLDTRAGAEALGDALNSAYNLSLRLGPSMIDL